MSDDASDGERNHDVRRGFARLTPEERRALGSKGGLVAHARGTANKFTPDAAVRAGVIPHQRGTAHQWTSEQAREAGAKGATTRRLRRSRADDEPKPAAPQVDVEEPASG